MYITLIKSIIEPILKHVVYIIYCSAYCQICTKKELGGDRICKFICGSALVAYLHVKSCTR